jgi:hypothetical protein
MFKEPSSHREIERERERKHEKQVKIAIFVYLLGFSLCSQKYEKKDN